MTRAFERLARRAEAATGSDRVLDGLIFRALEEREGDNWVDFGDGVWHRGDPDDGVAYDGPPNYTGSVDAASSAAPVGWYLTVGQRSRGRWSALLRLERPSAMCASAAETEAGARIAATLRAREFVVVNERKKT